MNLKVSHFAVRKLRIWGLDVTVCNKPYFAGFVAFSRLRDGTKCGVPRRGVQCCKGHD